MALVICIFLSLCVSVFGISDLRLCADAKCEELISYGVAKIGYVPSEGNKIQVKKGDAVKIYSKDAGNDTSLWGVEVGGKRGYMPKDLVKEERVLHKKLNYTVPTKTEGFSETNLPHNNVPGDSASDVPLITNSFSVVDGTTIYVNTSGEILETQPMETIAFNTQQSADIQSSKTIDATSISKNKLDEPNSSLILPQPTTSSAAMYSADGNEILGETESKILEDVKKSTVGTSNLENNEGELTASSAKESENIFEDRESKESNELPVSNEASQEDSEGEEGEEEDTQDGQDDEAEDEDEGEDEDEELDLEDQDGEDEENEEIGKEANKENEVNSESVEGDLKGSGERELQDGNISEPEIVTDNAENSAFVQREQVDIKSEPADPGHEKQRDETILDNDKQLNVLGETSTTSSLDASSMSKQSSINESGSETKQDSELLTDSETSENKDTPQSAGGHETSSETSSGEDASLEFYSNLSTDSEGKGVEEKDERVFNPFSPLGKFSEIENTEGDVSKGVVQNSDATISSKITELQDIPVAAENALDHTTNPIEDITTPSFEEYSPVTEQESVLEQVENQESVATTPSDEYQSQDTSDSEETVIQNAEDDNKLVQMYAEEASSEAQGTCETHSVGCMPESEDLPEQLSSSEDAKPGWFALLMGRTSMGPELLVSSSVSKEMQKNSFDTLLYLMVTAITVLVFSLGYYYIEKQRRDGSLIAKINSLEKALMVSSQEKYTLKDELENAKEKLSVITTVDSGETSSVLNDELEECRNARLELEEQVVSLEKELEAATEAGLELNRMMSELLTAQHGSDTLMKSVEHLQKQLDSQQSTISTMTANLTAKNLENENLQSELKLASERVQNLEEQLAKVNESLMNLQKEKSEIEHDFQVKNKTIELQLVEALESKSADSQRLCRELDALQDVLDETRKTLAAREGEVSVLRECLNHAECLSNGRESSISLEELLNVGHLRAKIDSVTKERDEFQEKLQGEEDARKLLEDHMKIVSEEVSTLRIKYEEADRGKMEAQTRLEVLSNYFKEKETQLQKELGLQEAMYIQKEGDALSTIEQIKTFQEEIENYKAQNEILKKEILDQERSMKSQIAVLEKKAHENWVAARQAERRMEESKQEASQLRNRLTMSGRRLVGTIPGPDVGKPPERGTLELEHNGEMSSSPAHMGETQELPSSPLHFGLPGSPPLLPPGGQPLPPGPFPGMPLFLPPGAPGMPFPMPPPPGGLFPDDLRPPPLGRMSSPPPEPRGSFSPFEHSPPMSPPSRPYRSPPHYEDSPSRYRHQTPPSSGTPSFSGPFSPGKWDERGDPPRSSFRPLHRDPPREPKGSTLSSGHSSESLDKGSRHSRV